MDIIICDSQFVTGLLQLIILLPFRDHHGHLIRAFFLKSVSNSFFFYIYVSNTSFSLCFFCIYIAGLCIIEIDLALEGYRVVFSFFLHLSTGQDCVFYIDSSKFLFLPVEVIRIIFHIFFFFIL